MLFQYQGLQTRALLSKWETNGFWTPKWLIIIAWTWSVSSASFIRDKFDHSQMDTVLGNLSFDATGRASAASNAGGPPFQLLGFAASGYRAQQSPLLQLSTAPEWQWPPGSPRIDVRFLKPQGRDQLKYPKWLGMVQRFSFLKELNVTVNSKICCSHVKWLTFFLKVWLQCFATCGRLNQLSFWAWFPIPKAKTQKKSWRVKTKYCTCFFMFFTCKSRVLLLF